MKNFLSNLFFSLFSNSLNKRPSIKKVEVLPELDQNLFPVLRSKIEAGRLISNARKNHKNDCQVIYAAITDFARIKRKWSPILHQELFFKIREDILPHWSNKNPIETAIRKNIITLIEIDDIWYLIPNHKKFKKYLDANTISSLNI